MQTDQTRAIVWVAQFRATQIRPGRLPIARVRTGLDMAVIGWGLLGLTVLLVVVLFPGSR